MVRIFYIMAGILLILLGVLILPLPAPGLLLIAIGLGVLVTWSVTARRFVRRTRKRNPRLNDWLLSVEANLPQHLSKILRKTAPGRSNRVH